MSEQGSNPAPDENREASVDASPVAEPSEEVPPFAAEEPPNVVAPAPRPSRWERARRLGERFPLVVLALCSAMAAGLILESQLFFIFPWPSWLNVDEPYITAFGWRMTEGSWLPYVDAVSHRGPVLYWTAAFFVKVFGPNWYAMRLLGTLSFAAAAGGSLWAGWRVKKPLAGIFGVLVLAWASLVQFGPTDGISFNGEPMLNAFALTAFAVLCSALAFDKKRVAPRLLFFAGALTSCALLSKQVGGALVLPFALWSIAAAAARGPFWKSIVMFALGGLTPVLMTVLRFVIAGELSTFWYYFIVYNRDVYLAPYGANVRSTFHAWLVDNRVPFGICTILCLAWLSRFVGGFSSWRAAARRYDAMGFEITVFISLLLSAASSNGSLRGFSHYFMQLMPWGGLAIGVLAHHIVGPTRGWRGGFAVLMLVVPPFLYISDVWLTKQAYFANERATGHSWHKNSDLELCTWLDKVTTKDDRILVWGFFSNVYVNCKRLPATRYVFTTFPAGVVPWDRGASPAVMEQRAVPGSQDILIAELEETKAPVLIDAGSTMLNKAITAIPKLKTYVEAKYCPAPAVMGLPIWRRKLPDGSCPAPPPAN